MAKTSDNPTFFARLFGDGEPREVDIAAEGVEPGENGLLWLDLDDPPEDLLERVWQRYGLPEAARGFLDAGTTPEVDQEGEWLWVRSVVVAEDGQAKEDVAGVVLVCVAGRNRVLTFRRRPIAFLDAMRAGNGRVALGRLSAESFVATLLDRQLSTYFDAVSDYEMAVERLEVAILDSHEPGCLAELQRLRRWSSRLRRMLAPHRKVFGVMSRPDFRPDQSQQADRHFVALDTRFERAMDMVENARDLVIGSFELFSNQTALRTNDFMRLLTFVTVVTGVLATIVGALGMNFAAGFFDTRDAGFWTVLGGLALVAVASMLVGRRRGWF